MSNKTDLYITYPIPPAEGDQKLFNIASSIIKMLHIAVERITKRKISYCIKGTDFQTSDYRRFMSASQIIVFFTHPEFEKDQDYISELEDICTSIQSAGENNIGKYSKVFKICLEPNEKSINPSCISELLSYDFFERNPYTRKIKTIDFESGSNTPYYGRILDLAYDIAATLNVENSGYRGRAEQERYIFLGLTTFDQQKSRDDIRRELQHYGYRVLPLSKLPLTGEEFEKALVSNLKQSDTVIQIMGSQYGEILKGTKYSLTDYQNRVIREYQQHNPDAGLIRFIWIPQNNKISDQRQALYLKRLRRDDASEVCEIIESPLETFKTILAAKLQDSLPKTKVEYENIHKVYLLSEETDLRESEELFSTLALSGLKVTQLDHDEQVGIYARHLQALRDSDAVVIYQNSDNQFWLNSKIRDLIKSPGIGREKLFKKVVIITRLTPDSNLLRMIKTKVEIVNTDGAEPELILQKLIQNDH